MNISVLSTRNLATLANAQRIANRVHAATNEDMAVIGTKDPMQPFKVEQWTGQAGAIMLVTDNTEAALRFAKRN